MNNPWKEILLSDYEAHMSLDSVMQLQGMNRMMRDQLGSYPAQTAMILGIAGGNGLEHIDKQKYRKIYGVDINEEYLAAVKERYPELFGKIECLCIDLTSEPEKLPKAELLIANLLIEYIGYECFQKVVLQVTPRYVSCVIQLNADEEQWVSDSPYLHTFDKLDEVHHQMEENALIISMENIKYHFISKNEMDLPNSKRLVQLDFQR